MNYSKAFKIIRATTGWSQKSLAYHVGLEPSLVSRIESGKRKPTDNVIKLISKNLGISPHLIDLLAKERNEIKFDGMEINKFAIELLKLLFKNYGVPTDKKKTTE